MTGRLKREIKQSRPFSSLEEEVFLNLIRSADQIQAPLSDLLREANLSHSQYNILRILRGAGDTPLRCGEITDRMVRRDPDVTRLLDRLEARGLVARSRGTADRRVVTASITDAGRQLVEDLYGPLQKSMKQMLSHMPAKRLTALVELLEEMRGTEAG
ncbi:MAG TPA: MarR family transcriptional regulator [Thermoanaerobaculia bacterium]|nr:MarR family transcriptional regulator [Thermoanaerobaculia bacterium]